MRLPQKASNNLLVDNLNRVLALTCVLIGLFFLPIQSFNQVHASGVSLSPIRSILNTTPDQKLEVEFELINEDAQTRKFEIIPAQVLGEDVVTDPNISKVEWLTVSHSTVELAANSRQTLKTTINVPKDAAAGSYKLLVIGQEIALSNAPNIGTGINLAVAYPIEVNVLTELPQGNLQAFIDVSPSFNLENRFSVSVNIENTGNISLYPVVYLKVFDPQGNTIYQETINAEQLVLSAKNSIKQDFEFFIQDTNLLNNIGEFTAEALAVDNQLQISARDIQKFTYVPALLALIVSVIALFAIWIVARLIRKVVFRRIKR